MELYLRSNGGLELSPGAILRGSPNLADYNPADFVPQNSASKTEVTSGGHLIAAVECSNIVLCGGGTIDGNHPAFQGYYLLQPAGEFTIEDKPWEGIVAGYEPPMKKAFQDYLKHNLKLDLPALNRRWNTARDRGSPSSSPTVI